MNLVMIEAGSTVFTPDLSANLTGSAHRSDIAIALVDISPWAVETRARYDERVAGVHGVELYIEHASDRREVLAGDRSLTLRALLIDPLVPSVETTTAMLGEALSAHRVRMLRYVTLLEPIERI